jgi:hypothetical protein
VEFIEPRRGARERARLEYGLSLGPRHFITEVRGFNLDLAFRRDAWYLLRTRLQQEWPGAQAWTCLEYSSRRGIHMHIMVRGAPTLTVDWLAHVVSLLPADEQGQRVTVDFQPVSDAEGLARYLTKQLRKPGYWDGMPRHFHPVSATHDWAPGWQAEADRNKGG